MTDVDVPVCATDRTRPQFEVGQAASVLALGYEDIKGNLLKAESCIDSMNEAIEKHRLICEKEMAQ